jgi:hypothetical protein
VHLWPQIAARSDEGLSRELRPIVSKLEDHSLLVTAVGRSLVGANPRITYYDLLDHSLSEGTGPESVTHVAVATNAALIEGRKVYYLYTHWEAGDDLEGDGRQGYQRYFDAVKQNSRVEEVFRSATLRANKYPWILYEVGRQ